jgi:hypothetical protein
MARNIPCPSGKFYGPPQGEALDPEAWHDNLDGKRPGKAAAFGENVS